MAVAGVLMVAGFVTALFGAWSVVSSVQRPSNRPDSGLAIPGGTIGEPAPRFHDLPKDFQRVLCTEPQAYRALRQDRSGSFGTS